MGTAAAATPTVWRLCRHFSCPLFSSTHLAPSTSPAIPRRIYHRGCLRRSRPQPFSLPPPSALSSPSSRRTLGTNSVAAAGSVGSPSGLYLYNTMSRQKEAFRPREPGKVGMYVCGVTTYDFSHIGHARVYVTFDVLYRYLRHMGYDVHYVRNFTDVDDKILDHGYAYRIGGDVYFSVDKFPAYGRLSGRKQEDNRAGERVAVDARKQNPADFALWKSAKSGEPYWESPWGKGRPGWHIECSAMSVAYLGHSFDIHGGGMDLVFPHHENEIAQSCAACGSSSISYWVHNGFVTVDSEKMSKSLGNFFTIRQVIEIYHPLALRLFLIGTHYRSPINYSDALLESASDRLFYIYQTLVDCEEFLSGHDVSSLKDSLPANTLDCINNFVSVFENSLADDLHTPVVLAALSEPLKTINDLLHTRKGKNQELRAESLVALKKEIGNVLVVLGLMPSSYSEALQQLKAKALKRAGLTEEQVLQKIVERTSARKNKQYERSDEIREELAAVGIALMDGPNGTTWRPGVPLHAQEHVAST